MRMGDVHNNGIGVNYDKENSDERDMIIMILIINILINLY